MNLIQETMARFALPEIDVFVYAHYFDEHLKRKVECDRVQALKEYTAYVNTGHISEHVKNFCRAVKLDVISHYMLQCVFECERL